MPSEKRLASMNKRTHKKDLASGRRQNAAYVKLDLSHSASRIVSYTHTSLNDIACWIFN